MRAILRALQEDDLNRAYFTHDWTAPAAGRPATARQVSAPGATCPPSMLPPPAADGCAARDQRLRLAHTFCSRFALTGIGVLSSCAKSDTRSSSSSQRNSSSLGSGTPLRAAT